MTDKQRKRPRDLNQLGKLIIDIAVGEVEERPPAPEGQDKNSAAVELGRRGGLKGGKARAETLSRDERRKSAQKAAKARWSKK